MGSLELLLNAVARTVMLLSSLSLFALVATTNAHWGGADRDRLRSSAFGIAGQDAAYDYVGK